MKLRYGLLALLLIPILVGVYWAAPKAVPLVILTTTLPSGQVGIPYSATIQASGGKKPYRWEVTAGALPPGMVLSQVDNNAILSGTPTGACIPACDFVLTVFDSARGRAVLGGK